MPRQDSCSRFSNHRRYQRVEFLSELLRLKCEVRFRHAYIARRLEHAPIKRLDGDARGHPIDVLRKP